MNKELVIAVAENYVLTQMSSSLDIEGDAYFWSYPKGDAEVDFQLMSRRTIIPIEVNILSNKNTRIQDGSYTFIPLCMAWKLHMYLEHLDP